MKQTIRMNEAELNRIISESVMRVLNEAENEVGTWDSHDANMARRNQYNPYKQGTKNKGYSMGASSAPTAMENNRMFNDMSKRKPLSKLRDKLKGAVAGYKKGNSGIEADQTKMNNLTAQNRDLNQNLRNGEQVRAAMGTAMNRYKSDMQTQLDQHNEFMNGTNIAGQENAKSMVKKNVKTLANNYIQNNVDPVTVAQGVTGAAQDVNKLAAVRNGKTANNKARTQKGAATRKQNQLDDYYFDDMMDGYAQPQQQKQPQQQQVPMKPTGKKRQRVRPMTTNANATNISEEIIRECVDKAIRIYLR